MSKIPSMRVRTPFNDNWRFTYGESSGLSGSLDYASMRSHLLASGDAFREQALGAVPEAADAAVPSPDFAAVDFDDSSWRHLNLPHDWGVEGSFEQSYPGETGKLKWWGVAWYRKAFNLEPEDENGCCFLELDGAMSYAMVWVNGEFAGGWPYGYASFRIDLTPFLKQGQPNQIAIRLDNPEDSSRWYPGGGIYRNVWLVKTPRVHVDQWGQFIQTPEVSTEQAKVSLRTQLRNAGSSDELVQVRTKVYPVDDGSGLAVDTPVAESAGVAVQVNRDRSARVSEEIFITEPRLWSTRHPNLYRAVTEVESAQGVIDRYETQFGIRSIRFDPDQGFFLNGQRIRMNGVCQHHDLGALGSALHLPALVRQLEILREMGVNAIRTSHNPPAPELLDLCDQYGLLVIDEAFDTWAHAKKPNDYHRLFPDWAEADLRAMVRRDRNHPCIVLWSTGNEIAEQVTPEGAVTSNRLTAIVRSEDSSRPVTIGSNIPEGASNGFQKTVDVFGFNYKPHMYADFRRDNPVTPVYGSETASTISSRGEYVFPVEQDPEKGRANFHMSAYDLYTPPWATTPDAEFRAQDSDPGLFGEFVWTGFDYIGEPTPYNADSTNLLNFSNPAERERARKELEALGKIEVPSRSSYFGIVDLAGFKKDRFFIYQARWRPDWPMAHLLPHWNWPGREGEQTPVHVYTSGDEAELLLNGRSLGRKRKGSGEYRLVWDDVVYEPGLLRVVAFKNGKPWAEAVRETTGPAVALELQTDRRSIAGDGRDLVFVTARVVDAKQRLVPDAKSALKFSLSGPGEILATDNGDPTDHTPFKSAERSAFNGLALAIVRCVTGASEDLTVKVESKGLEEAELRIRVKQ
ncbi:MAG: DUF4982 domain-containing protein [Opitutales bacterium]|nr:DUF4982 domain-containing protein [Opitutales bacterium]